MTISGKDYNYNLVVMDFIHKSVFLRNLYVITSHVQ